jgi:Ca-activated chloride channel homolog
MKKYQNIGRFGFLILILGMIFPLTMFAQSHQSLRFVREGNNLYNQKKYKDAEIKYRKAIDNSSDYLKATYNLGNSLYKQGQYDEALKCYQDVANHAGVDKKVASAAWHNTGNVLLNNKKYRESMDAFKNALKLDSKSDKARYNYEYARKKLQQQQQQQQQQNQQQNQQNQPQDKQQQQQQQQNQNKQDKKDKKQQQQKQQRQQQDKKDMERQLNALNQNEKKTTDKLKKEKQVGGKSKFEKDW